MSQIDTLAKTIKDHETVFRDTSRLEIYLSSDTYL